MNKSDIAAILSVLICVGLIISMVIKMRHPIKYKESFGEVIKKNHFIDPNHYENKIYVEKELYSITFLINGKKKSFYCKDGFFNHIKVGDKVKIKHTRSDIIDADIMK